MTGVDFYISKAAELAAKAQTEAKLELRIEYERLARSYLRLVVLAQQNSQIDPTLKPPSTHDDADPTYIPSGSSQP